MRPLKCYVLATWCLWNGHTPIPGVLSRYGTPYPCVMCKHCYKVLGSV